MTQPRSIHIDQTTTVNEIIEKHPTTVAAFNALGIDACCGGEASVAEAARRDGVDIDALIAALDVLITRDVEIP
jgi:iron-sulfur cluster repair protein YtfE (RIC family)